MSVIFYVALLPFSSHVPSPAVYSAAFAVLSKLAGADGGKKSLDLFEATWSEDYGASLS